MMEFANIDNSKNVPSGMGKFPVGRKRGALEGSYSAIRMSHEMTSLLSLDLLHGGGTVQPVLCNTCICSYRNKADWSMNEWST
jgi:hypothetical protein